MQTACFIPRASAICALALSVLLLSPLASVRAQPVVIPPGVAPAHGVEAQSAVGPSDNGGSAVNPAMQRGSGASPAISDFIGEPTGYRELISEALVEYEARHFEEARALFQRAHALFPNARTMRGQGMAEFELRNYGNAVQCFESALASIQRPLDGALRAETEQLLQRAKRFVARVRLELQPGTASVLVDGTLLRVQSGSVLLLSVGNHTFEIRADAYQPVQRIVTVQGGEEQVLEIALLPSGDMPARVQKHQGGPRRFAAGPQVSAVMPVRGYADRTPGMGFDVSFWSEFYSWAIDARIGVRFDLTEPDREYFHVPFELAGYRLLPFSEHALLFGVGTGLAYLQERVESTQTVGSFAVTRAHSVIEDQVLGVPILGRVGLIFFRNSVASFLTTVDYSITFAELKERSNEQAVRLHVGAIFGRSRP